MLYFTFSEKKDGAIRAIYNGRFAFLLEFPPDVALQIDLTDVAREVSQAARDGVLSDALKSLSEEERHQNLFLRCESGLYLNGLRFLARVAWLVRKREGVPRFYYRLRTQFFLEMYEMHEELAALLLRQGETNPGLKALKERIAAADRRLLAHWQEKVGGWFWLLKPVAVLIGSLLSRHFAVVTVDTKSSGRTATNLASGGLLNTSGSFGKRPGRRIERILTWLRPEAWTQISEAQVWRWMILKFQEERREILRQIADSTRAEALYASYVQRILAFLSFYMEIKDQRSVFRLEKLLLDVEAPIAQTPPVPWLGREDIFSRQLHKFPCR